MSDEVLQAIVRFEEYAHNLAFAYQLPYEVAAERLRAYTASQPVTLEVCYRWLICGSPEAVQWMRGTVDTGQTPGRSEG